MDPASPNEGPRPEAGPGPSTTVEEWALAYIESTNLRTKCRPDPPPKVWETFPMERDPRPGRPPELRITTTSSKSAKRGALVRLEARAKLSHKFWHHELQAAELMAWALLRFPRAPLEFRKGLLGIMQDEIRHMALYEAYLDGLGYPLGSFPVRDWFWQRVPTARKPVSFLALLGMGLEAANLEHTMRFADWFRSVGDDSAAAIQEQIGREEVAHVAFATRWFEKFTGEIDFERFKRALPPPLSPLLLRGRTIARERRRRAGMPEAFIDALVAYRCDLDGTPTGGRGS